MIKWPDNANLKSKLGLLVIPFAVPLLRFLYLQWSREDFSDVCRLGLYSVWFGLTLFQNQRKICRVPADVFKMWPERQMKRIITFRFMEQNCVTSPHLWLGKQCWNHDRTPEYLELEGTHKDGWVQLLSCYREMSKLNEGIGFSLILKMLSNFIKAIDSHKWGVK